jgi:hypothetical protein
VSVDIRVWNIDGTGGDILTTGDNHGSIVGPVATDAMVIWVGNDLELFTFPGLKPIRRYVGTSFEELTDVPNQWTQPVPPFNFHTYAGAAFHGQTAILLAAHQGDEGLSAFIYRSADGGHTWTQVHTWATTSLGKGSKLMAAYNGEAQGAWWVNGAFDGTHFGLWHSVDDGVTWTFVNTNSQFGFTAPALSSAARPSGSPV